MSCGEGRRYSWNVMYKSVYVFQEGDHKLERVQRKTDVVAL